MTGGQQNDYCNVTAWHNKGITGKVAIWNMETDSEHEDMTTKSILASAPGATVLNASLAMKFDNSEVEYAHVVYNGANIPVEDFIRDNNIKILTRSVGDGFTSGAGVAFWNDLKERYNLIMFNSAGNDGSDSKAGDDKVAIMVGACWQTSNGLVRANYSSVYEGVDFVDFPLYSGTSFSCPYLAGKAALLAEKNNEITQSEVYEYFKSHSEDMNIPGEDTYTGWGLVKMGDPTTVIKIGIGKGHMMIDDTLIQLDQPATIDKATGRTLVPVRAIAEALGCAVEWDQATQTVIIRR